MSNLTRVGIVGASGYSGEQLVALLARHPAVELASVTSRQLAGQPVAEAMPGLAHLVGDLAFDHSEPYALAAREDVDVWFLALPHGVAAEYALAFKAAGKRAIDLSADFRLHDAALYEEAYGAPHPAPELLAETPYVVPELANPEAWKDAPLIACPGCYPTSIQLLLVPLLRAGLIDGSGIVINSLSGVSGAGKKASTFYSYSERNESMVAYGAPYHRHVAEIEEQLTTAHRANGSKGDVVVQFTPHLVPLTRGIITTITAPAAPLDLDAVYATWRKTYADRPFITLLPSGTFPDVAHVARTNRALLSAVKDERTGNLVLTSAIDNLMKGASSQAVQILNLLLGLEETTGLL